MKQFIHPFDHQRTPDEVWAYLQHLLPEYDGWESEDGRLARGYALAIAHHYAHPAAARPECSVATVVATLTHEADVVLAMLATCPVGWQHTRVLRAYRERNPPRRVAGLLVRLTAPLGRINCGARATHVVQAYLSQLQLVGVQP